MGKSFCTIFDFNSGRLAVVKVTFTTPVFAAGDRQKAKVSFCVKIIQNEDFVSAKLVPNEKIIGLLHFVYHIRLCRENWGKLPAMNKTKFTIDSLAEVAIRVPRTPRFWRLWAKSPTNE